MIKIIKELIRVKNLPEKEKVEYKVMSYILKHLNRDRKDHIKHQKNGEWLHSGEWSDNKWLVSEISEFIQKDPLTSIIFDEFRNKYDYDTLNEILKNNFKSEYEQSLKKVHDESR